MNGRLLEFGSFALDLDRFSLIGSAGEVALRPKSFDVLLFLAKRSGQVVSRDELLHAVWPDVTVGDESLTRCISDIRTAIGDDRRTVLKTIARRGYLLDVPKALANEFDFRASALDDISDLNACPTRSADLRQQIRYCRARDAVRLAYAVAGRGQPLVKSGNWLHHLEYDWESPVWRHVLHRLASRYTLVRYDARGNGLSDWEVDDLSLEAWVGDLEMIVEAAGVERFPLLGISQGCAISVAYTVRHPERVSHLILYGGYVRGANKRSPAEKELRAAMQTLARLEWGSDNPAFRQLFTGNFIPGATKAQADSFNELQRRATSAECAARYMSVTADIDITDLLPRVVVPTLVVHVRGDRMVPLEAGKALAAGISGARFVVLPGENHFFLENEPASERFFDEIEVFLSEQLGT